MLSVTAGAPSIPPVSFVQICVTCELPAHRMGPLVIKLDHTRQVNGHNISCNLGPWFLIHITCWTSFISLSLLVHLHSAQRTLYPSVIWYALAQFTSALFSFLFVLLHFVLTKFLQSYNSTQYSRISRAVPEGVPSVQWNRAQKFEGPFFSALYTWYILLEKIVIIISFQQRKVQIE